MSRGWCADPAGVFAITHCTLKLRSYRHFGMTPRDITTWGRDSLLTNLSLEVPLYISHCKLMKHFVWPKHPDYPHYNPMKSLYHHSMIRPSSLCFMYFSWLTNDFRQKKTCPSLLTPHHGRFGSTQRAHIGSPGRRTSTPDDLSVYSAIKRSAS